MGKVIEMPKPVLNSRPLTAAETEIAFRHYPELKRLLGTEYHMEWDMRTESIWVVGDGVDLLLGLFLAISKADGF